MKSILLILSLFSAFARHSNAATSCKNPSLWVPSRFDPASLTVQSWTPYSSGNKGFSNKGGQVYKGGKGIWYTIGITNNQLNYELHWDNKAYPGGNVHFAIYGASSIATVRDKLCKSIVPLPSGTILDDKGPMDTATMSYFLLQTHGTLGKTVYKSPNINCSNKTIPFVLVSFLDYTNPKSRVLGRYFATNNPQITSSTLCKNANTFFKWMVLGVRCEC
jgi:hypothetical protein